MKTWRRIGALCRERGVALHSDCAQAAGKVPLALAALPLDFASLTAHKLYGPKGIGALYVRSGARGLLQPLMYGGGQERGLRPGTLPTHQIVGFGAACELAQRELPAESAAARAAARAAVAGARGKLGGVHLNGGAAERVPGILNVSFEGVQGESLVAALGGLAVSTGAACSSDSPDPSYVLRALGRDVQLAQSSLRFSLGRFTEGTEVDFALTSVREALARSAGAVAGSRRGAGGRGGRVARGACVRRAADQRRSRGRGAGHLGPLRTAGRRRHCEGRTF